MARVRKLAALPIEQHFSPNVGGRMSDHHGVVLHIAQGSYPGTIGWQLNPDQEYEDGTEVTTSSTWIVGRSWGEWAQMVDSDTVAWAQRSGSETWLSIELEGFAPAAPSAWQVEACAQLFAWSARTYGHPIAVADHPGERGLGHHAMDREWRGEQWGHDQCPGSGVISAKAAIVRRAREIEEGDDMTPEQVQQAFVDVIREAAERDTARGRHAGDAMRRIVAAPAKHWSGKVMNLVRAQQPLLEAAAQGQPLTAEQVADIAAAVAAAVPADWAEDVADEMVDELHERTSPTGG